MKHNEKRMTLIIWIIALAPLAAVAALYTALPQQVPLHWDLAGNVSYYGAKNTIWLLALLPCLLEGLFLLLPKIDPKGKSYIKFGPSYQAFRLVMAIFMATLVGITLLESLHPGSVQMGMVVTAMVSILFILLGNMMPRFRPNFFCGIRTPWTLSSETVWVRTHRLGGRLMFFGGFVCLVSAFLPGDLFRFILLMVLVAVFAIIPAIMSYLWYRQEQNRL